MLCGHLMTSSRRCFPWDRIMGVRWTLEMWGWLMYRAHLLRCAVDLQACRQTNEILTKFKTHISYYFRPMSWKRSLRLLFSPPGRFCISENLPRYAQTWRFWALLTSWQRSQYRESGSLQRASSLVDWKCRCSRNMLREGTKMVTRC